MPKFIEQTTLLGDALEFINEALLFTWLCVKVFYFNNTSNNTSNNTLCTLANYLESLIAYTNQNKKQQLVSKVLNRRSYSHTVIAGRYEENCPHPIGEKNSDYEIHKF